MSPSRPPRIAAAVVAAWAMVTSAVAWAQPADEGRAEALFREGREALQKDDVAAACAKFTASLEVLRRASTLLNLAQCEERRGRLVAARARWREGAALLPAGDDRGPIAQERLVALDKRIPRLVVHLAAGAPTDTTIAVDGTSLERAALEAGVELDPGDHAVVLTAPGRAEARSSVKLAEDDRRELTLAPGPATEQRRTAAAPAGPAPRPSTSLATRRTVGFVVGGVGLAGLVGAGVTGALVVSKDSDIDANCPKQRCNAAGYDAVEANRTLLAVNAVALGVGVVGLGVGVALVWTSRGGAETKAALAPRVMPGGGALSFEEAF